MQCVACGLAYTEAGAATITLQLRELVLEVRAVPAQVCPDYGETYVDEAAPLLDSAYEIAQAGAGVGLRRYAATWGRCLGRRGYRPQAAPTG